MSAWTPYHISRPTPRLLTYYIWTAALSLIAFPAVFLPLYFKYHTLRYVFDAEGIRMSWGILFRRETFLTYRRIQDIHLTRDIFERWLGLASVAVQTASGSALPEMTIVGVEEHEKLRDFLYQTMRGARDEAAGSAPAKGEKPLDADQILAAIRDDLNAAATALERRSARG